MHKGANFSLHCNYASVSIIGEYMINVKKARQVSHPLKRAVAKKMGGAERLYEVAADVAKCGANADFRIERYRYNDKTQELYIYFLNYGCYIFVGKCSKEVYKSKYTNQYV